MLGTMPVITLCSRPIFESEKVPEMPVTMKEPMGSTGFGEVPGRTPVFGLAS